MSRNPKGFDCSTCWHKNCDSDKSIEGSNGPAPIARWKVQHPSIETFESKTCLLPMISPLSAEFLRLNIPYKNGHLPFAGGMLNQPNIFIDAMNLIG